MTGGDANGAFLFNGTSCTAFSNSIAFNAEHICASFWKNKTGNAYKLPFRTVLGLCI